VTSTAAEAQQNQNQTVPGQLSARGTVVSTTDNTLVIRTDQGEYQLFVLDRDTARPVNIPVRGTVEIAYLPGDEDWVPAADSVRVTAQPAQGLAPNRASGTFIELKSTAYSTPRIRFQAGRSF
jgi:hypothetical protein